MLIDSEFSLYSVVLHNLKLLCGIKARGMTHFNFFETVRKDNFRRLHKND